MANNATSQAGSGNRHAQRGLHPGFSVIILGCVLTLVSFFFLDWNTSVLDLAFSSSSHSFSSLYRFINGPGVFQTLTSFDAVPAEAALWIWIVPVAAVIVLVFACAARYWNVRLLPLVALPAGVGFTLLTRFALTGEGQWGYTNIGYWLAVLGFFLVLVSGFWLGKASLIGGPASEGYLAAQAWCAIVGGSLVCLSFFLPWLLLPSLFLPYNPSTSTGIWSGLVDNAFLASHAYTSTTGLSLADGTFPFFPPQYPQLTPEAYWSLWLVPLAGLLGVGAAWASLRGRRISRWFWMLVSLLPLLFFLFLLRPIIQGGIRSPYDISIFTSTTYGWDLTLLGLSLLFFNGLLWKVKAPEEGRLAQSQHRLWVRRSLLAGICGLVAVGYGGYILWRTNRMYRTMLIISNVFQDAAIAWAADGRHLAVANSNVLHIWDVFARKQVRTLAYGYPYDTALLAVSWSPNQRFLAVTTNAMVRVFEVASGKVVSHWLAGGLFLDVIWSADSQRVVTAVDDNNTGIAMHDAITGKLLRTFPSVLSNDKYGEPAYLTVAWSPDNRLLAAGGYDQHDQVFFTLWDVSSGAQVFETAYMHNGEPDGEVVDPMEIAWSPDGKRLAVLHKNTGVKVWEVSSRKLLLTYVGSGGEFGRLAWSPDGRYMATGEGRIVRIWETTTGQTLLSYWGHKFQIRGLSWSSRGNTIASASLDSVRIWQPEIGTSL